MSDQKIVLLDKRQTAPDVMDDNPFDTSPKTEHEAYIEVGAQSIANEKVRHLQRTRPAITFRQLASCREIHPCFEMEMPPVQGSRIGLFYFTVGGEHATPNGGWKKFERCVVEGSIIEISAAAKAEAERQAEEGLHASSEHARRAFWAEEAGKLDELNDPNEGMTASHIFRPRN